MTKKDVKSRILILDDEPDFREALAAFLSREGHDVRTVGSGGEVFDMLALKPAELILADINAEGVEPDEFLRKLRRKCPETVPVVVTGYGSIEQAVVATKDGAFDYITKPVVDEEIRLVVEKALRQQALLFENHSLRQQLEGICGLENVVGRDQRIRRIFEVIDAVADSRTPVLIQGEGGTGKSLLARALHRHSPRRDRPFVEVACGALPEVLLEAELFGGERPGRFAAAEGGTLLLDEIETLSPALQVKLRRVLEQKIYEPAGSTKPRETDVRLVLATNTDLRRLVDESRFRPDLFYRINVVSLELPPLRDRLDDVPLLAEHFLGQFRREHGRKVGGFTPEASKALQHYDWPGNVRELENAIERATVLCKKVLIDLADLPELVQRSAGRRLPPADSLIALFAGEPMTLKDALEIPEQMIIQAALERNGWSRQGTANELQIDRTTLYKKMRRYKLGAAPPE